MQWQGLGIELIVFVCIGLCAVIIMRYFVYPKCDDKPQDENPVCHIEIQANNTNTDSKKT